MQKWLKNQRASLNATSQTLKSRMSATAETSVLCVLYSRNREKKRLDIYATLLISMVSSYNEVAYGIEYILV